ncbi:MAG TPA: hypothetical protein VG797_02750, partial [Phycisphaerales bacterium]|nr:hypothetical protein [Phycisphaerales bacterium]
MTRRLLPALTVSLAPIAFGGQGQTTAPFPMECGQSVATFFSGFNSPGNPPSGINTSSPSVAVVDNRIPGAVVPDPGAGPTQWNAANFTNAAGPSQDQWIAKNLGQVFGVCLDNANPPN